MINPFSEQQHLQEFVDASPNATAIYSGASITISMANQQMLDFWGRDRSVIGKPIIEAIPELVGQPFPAQLQQVFATGTTFENKEERAVLIVNGTLQSFYFSYIYKPIKETDGSVIGIVHTAQDITELVLARQRIAEAEERLSFSLLSAGIGTWDLNTINNNVKCDARCRELFGFTGDEEMPFAEVLTCIDPRDKQMVEQAVAAAISPDKNSAYDIRYRTIARRDGEMRWVHCKGKAYFNEAGTVYRFAGTAQDITKEVRLRRQEEQILSLLDNGADPKTIADLEGRMIYMNKAAKSMLGVSDDEEISSLTAVDFYTPTELARVQGTVISDLQERGGWGGVLNLRNKVSGEEIPCQVDYVLLRDPETGEVIGRGARARDLRPELKARQELADKNREMEKAVRELEFLANTVPSVVWTSTPDGLLDYINQRWYDHGATSLEEALGTGWAQTMHPDDVPAAWAAWSQALGTGNPYQIEFRLKDKNDKYRWWLVRAEALKDEAGKVIKWYGTNTDITEQKELARQKDNFLGMASHELKTPITSIKAYAQVMQTLFTRSGDTKSADMMQKMDRQVNRLNSLVGDLLDVTKINTGRLQFSSETFDFYALVGEITEDMQRTTTKHIIRKMLGFTGNFTGDKDRISQVITNLLSNAIKYSPLANEIVIYTEDRGDSVQLCVQDFGIGIRPDLKDKVFEQFYRVSGTKEYTFPGLGLGLYISSEIVKRMGGKIWVNSVEGKGSTFCFSLPLDKKINL
jgi:PAS domain S-box-containing protein